MPHRGRGAVFSTKNAAFREGGAKVCREFRTSRRALNVLSVRAGLSEQQIFAPTSSVRHIFEWLYLGRAA